MWNLIKSDLKRHRNKEGIFEFFYCFMMRPIFRYTFWLRVCHFFKKNKFRKYFLLPIPYYILKHYEYKFGISTSSNIEIGEGFHIKHGGAVYINAESIGSNFTCYQSVTLGVDLKKHKPIVGDNVTIYTGSVIYGGVLLGDGCVIGANSVVNKNVQENRFVAGSPAKEIKIIV